MKFRRTAGSGPKAQARPTLPDLDDGEEDGGGAWEEEEAGGAVGAAIPAGGVLDVAAVDESFRFLHRALTDLLTAGWRAAICW
jgi:hypothetical protein